MKFLATEFFEDGDRCIEFDAEDWTDAARICDENQWSLMGKISAIVPMSETFGIAEADEMVAVFTESDESVKH